jgi:hypothetical protein
MHVESAELLDEFILNLVLVLKPICFGLYQPSVIPTSHESQT